MSADTLEAAEYAKEYPPLTSVGDILAYAIETGSRCGPRQRVQR